MTVQCIAVCTGMTMDVVGVLPLPSHSTGCHSVTGAPQRTAGTGAGSLPGLPGTAVYLGWLGRRPPALFGHPAAMLLAAAHKLLSLILGGSIL